MLEIEGIGRPAVRLPIDLTAGEERELRIVVPVEDQD